MSWSWTLYRYLAIKFLLGIAIVYGTLLTLVLSIDVVDLLNRTGGRTSTSMVIGMALLQLPYLGQRVMPLAILGGGAFAFAKLSQSRELVATRAAGVSAWDFLAPPMAVAVSLGILAVVAFTPISARMLSEFSALEARYVKGQASQLAISENGLWLRQPYKNNQAVIHAANVTDQGAHIYGVLVLLYGDNDKFIGRIDAREGILKEGHWELQRAWVSDGKITQPVLHELYELPTDLTPAQIEQNFTAPDAISFWDLQGYIRNAKSVGYSAIRYELYFYSLLALPGLFAAMVLMAASFSLQLSRSRTGGVGKVILITAMAGFGLYFFNDLTTKLGQNGILPIILAATAPAVTAILIGMTLVFHQEDG